jgi:Cft2 family RNA processing exonuclease
MKNKPGFKMKNLLEFAQKAEKSKNDTQHWITDDAPIFKLALPKEKPQPYIQGQKNTWNYFDLIRCIPKKGLLIDFGKLEPEFPNAGLENCASKSSFHSMGIRMEWDCEEALGYDDDVDLMAEGFHEPNIITHNPRLKAQILQEQNYAQRYLFTLYALADFLKSLEPPKKPEDLGLPHLKKHHALIEKAVSKFGVTFISHAHADHIPLIRMQFSRENGPQRHDDTHGQRKPPLQYYCPIPVLCTPLTEMFLSLRFNIFVNNIYHIGTDLENTDSSLGNLRHNTLKDSLTGLTESLSLLSKKMYGQEVPRETGYFQSKIFNECEISLIPTGHISGSAGLSVAALDSPNKVDYLIEQRKRGRLAADLVYLNEYCPWARPHVYSPPPVVCNQLVLDGLFLDPKLELPNQEAELNRFLKWHEETIQQSPIIIFCQELGKPQFIISAIYQYLQHQNPQNNHRSIPQDYAIVLSAAMKRIQDCSVQGFPTPSVPILTKQEARKQKYPTQKNYLLFALPAERNESAILKLIEKRQARTAEITGWCVDPSYRQSHPASEYFALSDHASYMDTLLYLQKSSARQIMMINTRNSVGIHALRREGFNVVQYRE